MKHFSVLLAAVGIAFTLTACTQSTPQNSPSPGSSQPPSNIASSGSSASIADGEEITMAIRNLNPDTQETEDVERIGIYSGELKNGVPDGIGTFKTEGADGVFWTYEGEFQNGRFHGQGVTSWDDGYQEAGTYTSGEFTPNTAEFYKAYESRGYAPYSLSEKSFKFISGNPELFPSVDGHDSIDALANKDIQYKHLDKNVADYCESIYFAPYAYAVDVIESQIGNYKITTILACDEENNFSLLIYDGTLPNLFEDDEFSFYGLPLDSSTFENVSGGYTNVIVFAGCLIE